MVDDIKCLRSLQDNVSLKDIFKEDFLKKIEENFKEYDVLPIGLAFAKKGYATQILLKEGMLKDGDLKCI